MPFIGGWVGLPRLRGGGAATSACRSTAPAFAGVPTQRLRAVPHGDGVRPRARPRRCSSPSCAATTAASPTPTRRRAPAWTRCASASRRPEPAGAVDDPSAVEAAVASAVRAPRAAARAAGQCLDLRARRLPRRGGVALEHIVAGDIFQVQVSRRFERAARRPPLHAVHRAAAVQPHPVPVLRAAPRSARWSAPRPRCWCASAAARSTTAPSPGTRRRGRDEAEDAAMEAELRGSEKEQAEHLMLVDLGRNDVGRVAATGSVEVHELAVVERYSHVMHLVSGIRARLAAGRTALDALRACFPAGTVTGAPKIRAMEIIAELEPHGRGPYAGAVGYIGSGGVLDTAIALRTVVVVDGQRPPAGGGRDRRRLRPPTRRPARSTTSWPRRWTRSRGSTARDRAAHRICAGACSWSTTTTPSPSTSCSTSASSAPTRWWCATTRPSSRRGRRRASRRRSCSRRARAAPRTPASASTWCATRRATSMPLLGVCLGHQAIGRRLRRSRGQAPAQIMHGKCSDIEHAGDGRVPRPAQPAAGHPLPLAGGGACRPAAVAGWSPRGRPTAR